MKVPSSVIGCKKDQHVQTPTKQPAIKKSWAKMSLVFLLNWSYFSGIDPNISTNSSGTPFEFSGGLTSCPFIIYDVFDYMVFTCFISFLLNTLIHLFGTKERYHDVVH